MLKFLRRYQGVLLVTGGSLLMVVFLLGNVINRFGPTPGSQTVATFANGDKLTERETYAARYDLDVLRQVAPWMFDARYPNAMLALDRDEDQRTTQWLLLVKEARANGLIGEAEDGKTWVPDIARQTALVAAAAQWLQQLGQGANNPQPLSFAMGQQQIQSQAAQVAPQFETQLQSMVAQLARQRANMTEDDVWMVLARARGVSRLLRLYATAPRLSSTGAVAQARAQGDTVIAESLAIPASVIARTLPEATPEQLEAHFERFRADEPGFRQDGTSDNPFGIGYVLGPRLKLSYLALEPDRVLALIDLDRVEVSKRYQQDRTRYTGEFADEVYRVEADMLGEKTRELMIAADQAVRAAVFVVTEPLEPDGPYKRLPDDWQSIRPTWDAVADKVASTLSRLLGKTVSAADVTRVETIDDRWLTGTDLQGIDGLGQAAFQGSGGVQIPVAYLPEFVPELQADKPTNERRTDILVQVGLPMADQAATDTEDNRYYVTVLDAKAKSPADDISEIDHDLLVTNERLLRGYDALLAQRDELLARAKDEGMASLAADLTPDDQDLSAPEYTEQAMFTRDRAQAGRSPAYTDAAVRNAVIDAADALPEIVTEDDLPEAGVYVTEASPKAKALVIARITGKLPMTLERFRGYAVGNAAADQVGRSTASQAFQAARAEVGGDSPFSLDALKARWGYQPVSAGRPGQTQAQPNKG